MKIVLPVLLTLLTPVVVAAPSNDDGLSQGHRSIIWRHPTSGVELHGLLFIQLRPEIMATSVLAETPGGAHLRIEQTLDARTGTRTTELYHPSTGWRAVLERPSRIQRPTLQQLFRASDDIPAGAPISLRLILPGENRFEAEIPLDLQEDMHRDFVEELTSAGALDRVVASVPPELRTALFFLESSLSPNPLPKETGSGESLAYGLRDVVEILAGALRAAGAGPAEPQPRWTMEVGARHSGLEAEDPEVRGLFERVGGVTDLSVDH